MGRTGRRAGRPSRGSAGHGPRKGVEVRIETWWDTVLAGAAVGPHPLHGEDVVVRLTDGCLHLVGQVDDSEERDELIQQARSHIGHGIDDVDAGGLLVRSSGEKAGVLDQTLVAALPDRKTAELVRTFVVEHGRVKPRADAIIEPGHRRKLKDLLSPALAEDAERMLDRGMVLLVLRVDETSAFTVRMLLEEDTRSTWTVAAPPELPHARKVAHGRG